MFVPSKGFIGTKPGYVFSTVKGKTGYYPDPLISSSSLSSDPPSSKRRKANDTTTIPVSTLKTFKSSILTLEKLTNSNLTSRSNSTDPSSYIESETDLYLHLQSLLPLFSSIDPDFFTLNILETLVGLSTHDNSDIVEPCLELIKTCIEFDSVIEKLEELGFSEVCVTNLSRLKNPETTLNLLEDIPYKIKDKKLYNWCVKSKKGGEVLSVWVMEMGEEIGEILGEDDGMLVWYHGSIENGEDVGEAILASTVNSWKSKMVEFEGIELMLRWIGEGRGSAVMILNNLIYDEASARRVVKSSGLKPLFKILLQKLKTSRSSDSTTRSKSWKRTEERTIVNIIWSLSKYLKEGEECERFYAKFVEGEGRYIERLIEILTLWDERGRTKAKSYLISEEAEADEDDGLDIESEAKSRSIDGGLDTFYYGCEVLARVMKRSKRCWGWAKEGLSVRGGGVSWIKDGCREM
ncbi:hypothetical protein TL16_g09231, partial [Triparma laevis f. inornata]